MEDLVNTQIDYLSSSYWAHRRVFITGATGLVGSGLTKALIRLKAKIIILVRDYDPQSELIHSGMINQVSVVNGQVEDLNVLERAIHEYEIDTVFHLAAQPLVDVALRNPLLTFESNIRGTYHLLEACRRAGNLVKAIVVASSDKAYGEKHELPYREDMSLEGAFPYEVSKSCADLLANTYFQTYHLPIGIARCGNIFGPGDLNWSRIVPGTIRSCLAGEAPIIRSDGNFLRDYIFLEDVVNAYLCLAYALGNRKCLGEAFNFGYGEPNSVIFIVTLIQKMMGCSDLTPIIQNKVKNEIRSQYLDSHKAKQLLNWKSSFTLEEGLRQSISWYRKFLVDGETL